MHEKAKVCACICGEAMLVMRTESKLGVKLQIGVERVKMEENEKDFYNEVPPSPGQTDQMAGEKERSFVTTSVGNWGEGGATDKKPGSTEGCGLAREHDTPREPARGGLGVEPQVST